MYSTTPLYVQNIMKSSKKAIIERIWEVSERGKEGSILKAGSSFENEEALAQKNTRAAKTHETDMGLKKSL